MPQLFFILGAIYVAILAGIALSARKENTSQESYLNAGSNLGVVLGGLTVAATLFSTFTLMGMPDFFRTHGVGAWIFLGLSDAIFAFVVLWFGVHLRKKAAATNTQEISSFLNSVYQNVWAGRLYLVGVFVFLLPYIAIQLRGIGIFLAAIFPDLLPYWGWSTLIVAVLLVYSSIGGLRAIVYADALQGVLLLAASLIIAFTCILALGGVEEMFSATRAQDPSLLSVPGPKGLFSFQFLLASMLALVLVPVTQPQVTQRILVMKDTPTMRRMAVFLGVFAMLVILATLPIGLYGAVKYPELPLADYLANVLVNDQAPIVGAVVVLGLIAAAISTSDSQLFALGNELRSSFATRSKTSVIYMRIMIIGFAIAALGVSVLASDQLVLVARVSFAGTSILAPMVLLAVSSKSVPPQGIIIVTGIALCVFLSSVLGLVPSQINTLRTDLLLLVGLSLYAFIATLVQQADSKKAKHEMG